MREKQFRSRMDKLHRDVERRIKQNAEKRDLKFQSMLGTFLHENDHFVKVRCQTAAKTALRWLNCLRPLA